MRSPHWSVTVGAMYLTLIPAAVWSASHAKADPTAYVLANATSVCAVLDHDPNVDGVAKVVEQLTANGLNLDQTADVLVLSIQNVCPRHIGWFTALAEEHARPVKVSGGVGGMLG